MKFWLAIAALVILIATIGGAQAKQLNVTASILPLADFVKNVGREHVKVSCVLAAGSSPHTFTPSPADVKKLARSDLFVTIGIGLEEWADDFVAAAAQKNLKVLKLGESLGYKGGDNPHIWLDPVLAQRMIAKIAESLSALAPAASSAFLKNASEYTRRLQALHSHYVKQLAPFKGKKVVQFHPAFSYLLKRYHLGELAVIEPHPGKKPTSKHLSRIIGALRKEPVRIILMGPQLSEKTAHTIAREAQATIVMVDPLGDPTIPSMNTYISLMELNLKAIVGSLR
ncbi:zinc ABC transporter substrate-binding protein [bacterium]|nr:zinc ABC transporter substrate-binding protein [bacterium]